VYDSRYFWILAAPAAVYTIGTVRYSVVITLLEVDLVMVVALSLIMGWLETALMSPGRGGITSGGKPQARTISAPGAVSVLR
jgi:hypothetical protein